MRPLPLSCAALLAVAIGQPVMARDRSRPPEPLENWTEWFGPDDYPPAALRREEEGRALAMLSIDEAGRVTGCHIIESSGFADLDRATCAGPTRRAHFKPARNAAGKPVAGTYTMHTIQWRIPHDAPPPTPSPAAGQ